MQTPSRGGRHIIFRCTRHTPHPARDTACNPRPTVTWAQPIDALFLSCHLVAMRTSCAAQCTGVSKKCMWSIEAEEGIRCVRAPCKCWHIDLGGYCFCPHFRSRGTVLQYGVSKCGTLSISELLPPMPKSVCFTGWFIRVLPLVALSARCKGPPDRNYQHPSWKYQEAPTIIEKAIAHPTMLGLRGALHRVKPLERSKKVLLRAHDVQQCPQACCPMLKALPFQGTGHHCAVCVCMLLTGVVDPVTILVSNSHCCPLCLFCSP